DALPISQGLLGTGMHASRDAALTEGVGYAQEFAPIDTGALAGSITILTREGWGGSWGTNLVYAWQREEGGPIEGNPYLVFEWNGRLIFARRVVQEGSHYMRRSAEAMEGRVDDIYGRGVDRVMASL